MLVLVAAIVVFSVTLFAGQAAVVYGGSVSVSPGKAVRIPIRIKENPGVMGFRITVQYDPEFLEKPTVTGAGITEKGLLNDSISTSEPGSFDVVWCADADAKGDTDLFILGFTVAKDAADETTVAFSYSSDDTFNERWEPVELSLTPILLTVGDDPADNTTHTAGAGHSLTDRVLVDAVRVTMDEYDIPDFGSVGEAEQEKVLERVNDLLWQMEVSDREQPKDFSQLHDQYTEAQKNVFLEDVENSVDRQEIDKALQTALEKNGYTTIEDIPPEQMHEVLEDVYSAVRDANPELVLDVPDLSDEKAVALVNDMANLTEEDLPEHSVNWLLPVVLILLIAVAAAVTIVIIKRKKRGITHEEA